ncbi:cupin domain-containing protein [Pseudoxanthomonas sp. z9]|uniref:cupin domain-containing protein n=1 Tax=Pseudoxanthomonas sp. z9 TaxID=2584942 RepID=UPI001141BB07|nr:cupin domain-containing protein [Pseudoxanthomonas sp. z9]
MLTFDPQERVVGFDDARRASDIPLAKLSEATSEWVVALVDIVDGPSVDARFWERHPGGDKILYVLEGGIVVTLAPEDGEETTASVVAPGGCVIPKDTWHRLQVLSPGRMLCVTPRTGTEDCGYG